MQSDSATHNRQDVSEGPSFQSQNTVVVLKRLCLLSCPPVSEESINASCKIVPEKNSKNKASGRLCSFELLCRVMFQRWVSTTSHHPNQVTGNFKHLHRFQSWMLKMHRTSAQDPHIFNFFFQRLLLVMYPMQEEVTHFTTLPHN